MVLQGAGVRCQLVATAWGVSVGGGLVAGPLRLRGVAAEARSHLARFQVGGPLGPLRAALVAGGRQDGAYVRGGVSSAVRSGPSMRERASSG